MTISDPAPRAAAHYDLRLSEFIRVYTDEIVAEWITFARTRTPASESMTSLALRDHIHEILEFIAEDIDKLQTAQQQVAKSKGEMVDETPFTLSAAEIHATLRLEDGFDIDQMVSEYRALRASVVKRWLVRKQSLADTDLNDLTRFNETIDQALAESVAYYTRTINRSRNMFLGILGHDLRNPIGAATMAAERMVKIGPPGAKQTTIASQIVSTTKRATHILDDLLIVTRTAFGTDIPIVRTHMDLAQIAGRLVDEMRSLSSRARVDLTIIGDTQGEWDESRIGQLFSNLIGNAIQYSPRSSVVAVKVAEQHEGVIITVHNDGEPIPPSKLKTIFDFMTRGSGIEATEKPSTNLGLGLFISKKIVDAHGGKIDVSSTQDGTTFTVTLPSSRTL